MQSVRFIFFLFFLNPQTLFSEQDEAAQESVIRFSSHESGVPNTFDPLNAGSLYSTMITTAVFDTLYEYKYLARPFKLKPSLAASMPLFSSDRLTITIPLRKGVLFADDPCFPEGKGREVTAHDFIYSIKRHFDPRNHSTGRWVWQGTIEGIEEWAKAGADYKKDAIGLKALDSHTIQIKLLRAFPNITYTLAMAFSAVVPHEAVKAYGKGFDHHPVGTGPWVISSIRDKAIEFTKNPNYRTDRFNLENEGYMPAIHQGLGLEKLQGKNMPLADRIRIDYINSGVKRWHELAQGDSIQYIIPPTSIWSELISTATPFTIKKEWLERLNFSKSSTPTMIYFHFNMDDQEVGYHPDPIRNLKNKALRCAIRTAFNWRDYIYLEYHGIGEPFPGIIPPQLDGFDPNLSNESITQNLSLAKATLHRAGWKPSELPILPFSGINTNKFEAKYQMFKRWMKAIGYPEEKIVKDPYPSFSAYRSAMYERKVRFVTELYWSLDFPDAENILQLFYGPNKSPGSNLANYSNPEFDELYRKIASMPVSSKRNTLIRDANKVLVDDCVCISGIAEQHLHVWHKNLIMYPYSGVIGNIFKYLALDPNSKQEKIHLSH